MVCVHGRGERAGEAVYTGCDSLLLTAGAGLVLTLLVAVAASALAVAAGGCIPAAPRHTLELFVLHTTHTC